MGFVYNAPSVLERREGCPGSGTLEAECPRSTQTEKMAKGIQMHKWAQEGLVTGLVPASIPEKFDQESVRLAMAHTVALTMKYAAEVGLDAAAYAQLPYEPDVLRCEVPIQLGHIGYKGRAFIDVVIDLGKVVLVIELKMGEFEVTGPLMNRQLHCYFSGVARIRPAAENLVGVIIQPALVPECQCREWMVGRAKVADLDVQLTAIIKATLDPSAPLEWGDHCSFCQAKEMCPARLGTLKKALEEFSKAKTVAEVLDAMEPAARAILMKETKQASKVLKERFELIKAWKLNSPTKDLPGWIVRAGMGNREFEPGPEARAKIWERVGEKLEAKGLKPDDLAETVSPTKVAELVAETEMVLLSDLIRREPKGMEVVEEKAPKIPKPRKG